MVDVIDNTKVQTNSNAADEDLFKGDYEGTLFYRDEKDALTKRTIIAGEDLSFLL